MRPSKIVLVLAGLLAAVVGLGMAVGGGVLLWAHATQRDDDGFYSTRTERLETPSEIRKAKRELARILTIQRERQLGIRKEKNEQ